MNRTYKLNTTKTEFELLYYALYLSNKTQKLFIESETKRCDHFVNIHNGLNIWNLHTRVFLISVNEEMPLVN